MRFSLIRSFVVALGCLGIVCQSAHANTATPLSHQNVANQKIHKPKAAAKNAQHANAAQKKQQKQAAKVAQNKQAKQQKAAAVVVPGNDIKAAKQAVEQAKKNVQAAKATHKQPAIKKAQNALKQAQQVLQAAQAQKKAKAQKQLETPVVVAASAAPVVATVGTPVPVVTTASVTPAVTVTTAAAPSTQDVKMLENLVAGSVSKAVAQQKDSVWPQRVQKAEQIATQAAAAVTQAASSVGAQLAAVVTSATISNTAKSMADIPAGTIVGLYSVRDNQFVQIDGDKFLKPGVTEADVANQPKAQFKMVNDGTNVGFERTETNGNRLQCEPGSKIARFENANFGDWEKMVAEFDGDTVYLKSLITNNYLGSNDAANKQLYAMNPKGDATKFKIKIIKAAPAAAPVTAAAASATISNTAKSMADIPAGTIVGLYSVRDNQFVQIDGDKFLKPGVTEADVANQPKAQFKMVNDGTNVGFERTETNGNRLQCEPGSKIARFENANFGDWEKMVAEFDGDTVYLKSVVTNNYLGSNDAANKQLYAMNPKGDATKFKIKIIKAASAAAPVTAAPAAASAITASYAWYGLESGTKKDTAQNGKSVAQVINESFIKNGNRFETDGNFNALLGDPVPGQKKVLAIAMRGPQGLNVHLRFIEGVAATWTWGSTNLANPANGVSGVLSDASNNQYFQAFPSGTALANAATSLSPVWGVNAGNEIYMRTGITAQSLAGSDWWRCDGSLMNISASGQYVWGVNRANQIFFRTGVTGDNPRGTGWQQIDGALINVSVNNQGTLWGVNAANEIFMRTGTSAGNPTGSGWQKIDGALMNVSVTNAGILYGVNRNNDIFVRTGISATNPVGSGWQQIDGKLINISANEKVLWGVNGNNDIFMRTGVSPYKLAGDGWKQVDGKLMNISVDANGVVWGVNSANDIFMRTGISDANPAGTGWLNVPGKLINITN